MTPAIPYGGAAVGPVYRFIRDERRVPVTAISPSIGRSERDVDRALEYLRFHRLVDDSRDTAGAVRATSPLLALGRLALLAMADEIPEVDLAELVEPETVAHALQRAALQSVTQHIAVSVDCFTALTETAVTMAERNLTVYHARPLLGSTQAVRSIVEYARLKGLPVTSVWSRAFVAAAENAELQQWLRERDIALVVHSASDVRGVVIDDGRLGVLHHDLEGVVVRTRCDGLTPESTGARPASRRLRVLRGVVDGNTDEELSVRLNVSVKTIRRDVTRVRELLGVSSRTSLIATARVLHLA
ncbi:Bacterial regulatory proteins, luxR family [Nocardia otitidiscaviarum]|uniref:Bacterial regulatory proteins, luxR family n=1 Tax=Nocardia otitidiscaviarum TaxID=1823 RepID=A0A378YWX6_9NOCA|nr:LuxR C-terminal-related transcriptional regulator [Nocardia otitidiscaviarum]SUA81308.1 Bacterial regulatory proteins, luxR family [Nocardia otitidiscaviarum]